MWGCVIAVIASPLLIHKVAASGSVMSIMLVTLVCTIVYAYDAKRILFSNIQRRRAGTGDHHHGEAMSILDHEGVVGEPHHLESATIDPRGELLMAGAGRARRDGMQYCILHGYQDLPRKVGGDIDMLLPREVMPRGLAQLLQTARTPSMQMWCSGSAEKGTLHRAGEPNEQRPAAGDASTARELRLRSERRGLQRKRNPGAARRQTPAGFYVPGAEVEFASVLANRIDKGEIRPTHAKKLSELWNESPDRCRQQLARLLPAHAKKIETAAESGDWTAVTESIQSLRAELRRELRRVSGSAWRFAG